MTAAEIDDRVNRVLNTLDRALERGDIDTETYRDMMQGLAKWSAYEYAQLPQVKAFESIMNAMFGGDNKFNAVRIALNDRGRGDV